VNTGNHAPQVFGQENEVTLVNQLRKPQHSQLHSVPSRKAKKANLIWVSVNDIQPIQGIRIALKPTNLAGLSIYAEEPCKSEVN
jgi:hypothetical protein